MSNFTAMGKGALRQAMRDAGLSYAGLNVQGMREALEKHETDQLGDGTGALPGSPGDVGVQEPDLDDDAANASAGAAFSDYDPHAASNKLIADAVARDPELAALSTHNYLPTPEQRAEDAAALVLEEHGTDQPGGPVVAPIVQEHNVPMHVDVNDAQAVLEHLAAEEALTAPIVQEHMDLNQAAGMGMPVPSARNTSKGVKIEKDRPTQNGVKMPSAGSLCRAVWDELERAVTAGSPHDAKSIKAHAGTVGWNANNASIEFYNWRKFKGISGRSK